MVRHGVTVVIFDGQSVNQFPYYSIHALIKMTNVNTAMGKLAAHMLTYDDGQTR